MKLVYTYHGWEGSFNPVDMRRYLEGAYTQYQRCHKDASTVESVDLLSNFFSTLKSTNPNRDPDYVLPAVGPPIITRTRYKTNLSQDRDYRKAVIQQQESSEIARTWYIEEMPVRPLLSSPLHTSYIGLERSRAASTAIRGYQRIYSSHLEWRKVRHCPFKRNRNILTDYGEVNSHSNYLHHAPPL